MIVMTGTSYRDMDHSESLCPKRKPPSPCSDTTWLSGRASLTPIEAPMPQQSERPSVRPIFVFLPSAKGNERRIQSSVPTSSTMIASSSSISFKVSKNRGQVIGLSSQPLRAAIKYDCLILPVKFFVAFQRDSLSVASRSLVTIDLTAS